MGDRNKEFNFTVSFSDPYNAETKEDVTFTLKDDGTRTIADIPAGMQVTITENADGYTASNDKTEGGDTATFTINADTTVVFTNQKDVDIDTGINLSNTPFLLLLLVAVGGAVMLLTRRRRTV